MRSTIHARPLPTDPRGKRRFEIGKRKLLMRVLRLEADCGEVAGVCVAAVSVSVAPAHAARWDAGIDKVDDGEAVPRLKGRRRL